MNRSEHNRKRKARKAKRGQQIKRKAHRLRAILDMGEACPDLDDFITSLDMSGLTKLLGVFCCQPDKYLATETVLAENGHLGYQVLQCEIEGERSDTEKNGPRGWTSAVKKDCQPDEQYRTFVGIVRRPLTGDSAKDTIVRWGGIVAVAHEIGHAHDFEKGLPFQLGDSFDIAVAEFRAHQYACRLLSERGMTMGLVAYLSMTICAVAEDPCTSVSDAAKRFMKSEQYRECLNQIPSYVRQHFDLVE